MAEEDTPQLFIAGSPVDAGRNIESIDIDDIRSVDHVKSERQAASVGVPGLRTLTLSESQYESE